MSYRCEICRRAVPPNTPATRVVLAIRPRTYPYRSNAHRDPKTHEPQHGEIWVHPPSSAATYLASRRRIWSPRDDPGGKGYEAVKEVMACPICAASYREQQRAGAIPRIADEPITVCCDHLREIGIIEPQYRCCPRCHTDAGLVVRLLPHGHEAVFCCARIAKFTIEEEARILAKIPEWRARSASGKAP